MLPSPQKFVHSLSFSESATFEWPPVVYSSYRFSLTSIQRFLTSSARASCHAHSMCAVHQDGTNEKAERCVTVSSKRLCSLLCGRLP
jgi:hypothetical protein